MRTTSAERAPHTVVSLVCRNVSLFELAVTSEVFGVDRDLARPWYRHVVAAAEPGPLLTPEGLELRPVAGLEVLAEAGTVVVPGWPADHPFAQEALDALLAAHQRGARMVSLCTGAFALAAAGLLDGRPATTHWRVSGELLRRHPAIELRPNVLYVDDGDVLTSAGTAAAVDLCLHLVRRDHGATVANALARRMVVPPHRDGGQAQFVETALPEAGEHEQLSRVLAWAVEHLHEALTVERLAARAAMAPRTFARQFRAATGTTPHQWLVRQRVLRAQQLLESTDLPVERVAAESGFGSAAVLRQHFARQLDCSPTAYRRTFRGAVAGADMAMAG